MQAIRALGLFVISVASSFAYQVQVHFDSSARFSSYRTYRWVHSAGAQPSRGFPAGLNERISGLVQEQLAAKGLKPVSTGGDLVVGYHIYFREYPQNVNLSDGLGPTGLGWGDATYIATIGIVREWTLVINMLDRQKNRLAFEGTLTETLSSKPEKNAKRLARAANTILTKYPPSPYPPAP